MPSRADVRTSASRTRSAVSTGPDDLAELLPMGRRVEPPPGLVEQRYQPSELAVDACGPGARIAVRPGAVQSESCREGLGFPWETPVTCGDVAEGEGFEPSRPLRAYPLSREIAEVPADAARRSKVPLTSGFALPGGSWRPLLPGRAGSLVIAALSAAPRRRTRRCCRWPRPPDEPAATEARRRGALG
jgi:hypothetical protein